MKYYIWNTPQKERLKKLSEPSENAHIAIDKQMQQHRIYSRYNAHDHYMGFPYSENLMRIMELLKQYNIDYELIKHEKDSRNEFYIQTAIFAILTSDQFKLFKRKIL